MICSIYAAHSINQLWCAAADIVASLLWQLHGRLLKKQTWRGPLQTTTPCLGPCFRNWNLRHLINDARGRPNAPRPIVTKKNAYILNSIRAQAFFRILCDERREWFSKFLQNITFGKNLRSRAQNLKTFSVHTPNPDQDAFISLQVH